MPNHGTFLWCDLSTLHLKRACAFYADLFGWQVAHDDYAIASNAAGPVAGLFPMPQRFRDIGMPSFWMSYIGVRDIGAAVATATTSGGKVELGPEPFPDGGQIALIRDPLGAGFTVYQGSSPAGVAVGVGGRRGHALFVSDAHAVMPFYQALFGWQCGQDNNGTRAILQGGGTIAHLHEVPDPALRGTEEYWAVIFSATPNTSTRLPGSGGHVLASAALPEGAAKMATDPDGAMFFFTENAS